MPEKTFRKQSAVLAYRQSDKGLRVALVTSMGTRRWVLPKGNIDAGRTARDSAALEALEEAGVEGTLGKRSIGSYEYEKAELKGGDLCRVEVFAMAVTRIKRNWPEKGLRRRKWMTLEEAAAAVDEAGLKKLIARFGKKFGQ